jgi:hypothetical protein
VTGISKRALIFVILLAVFGTHASADDGDPDLDGLPIVAIRVESSNIFDTSDPNTDAWFYRWANALHVVSKEDFIRSMLLFEEGDLYSASAAAESARILRSLGIMNPVDIIAKRSGDGVELLVRARDQWTLQVGAKLGVFGSRSSVQFDIEEENLFGWGKYAGVAYESDDERNGWAIRYFDPNVFNSRWRIGLTHADLSDGFLDRIVIDRPFYSLSTPWTWGVSGSNQESADHLYSQSVSVVEGLHETEDLSIWGGGRLPGGGDITRRVVAGWEYRRDLYSDWFRENTGESYQPPEDRLIKGPRLSFQQIADRFIVVRGFHAWTVQEDVALGPNFALNTVYSSPSFGGDRERLLASGNVHLAKLFGDWLVLGDAWFSGRLEDGQAHNLVGGFQIGAAELGIRGFRTRLLVENSRRLDRDRQLTLGADLGLRGWDPDFFDGTGRAVLNLQWRRLVKEEILNLFSLGFVIFGDAGITWDAVVGDDTGGVKLDAGAGLLFDLSHIGRSTLLRIDAALPSDGSGITVTVSTSTIFELPDRYR